jgi:ribosome-associated protein
MGAPDESGSRSPLDRFLMDGIALAEAAARLAESKLAEDIVILDLRGISSIADFFVICSGTSKPHLRAVRDEIREKLREGHGRSPRSVDGQPDSLWTVLDYGDVMVHVFHPERRDHFSLEDLWGDAPKVVWEAAPPVAAPEG